MNLPKAARNGISPRTVFSPPTIYPLLVATPQVPFPGIGLKSGFALSGFSGSS